MSLRRYAAKRDKNERGIIDALEAIGAQVIQVSEKGLPDLMVNYRGQTYLMEVKARKGKLTEAQKAIREEWQGQEIFIVRSVEQALAILNAEVQ